jgi:site-specific recombinase XerD
VPLEIHVTQSPQKIAGMPLLSREIRRGLTPLRGHVRHERGIASKPTASSALNSRPSRPKSKTRRAAQPILFRGAIRSASVTPDAVYKLVKAYSAELGFEIGAHALCATAATNALDHQADIAKVQEWLGHANIATTRIYDHRKTRPEDSPTLRWHIDNRPT